MICCHPAAIVSARLSATQLTPADSIATKRADRVLHRCAAADNVLTTTNGLVAARQASIHAASRVCCHLLTTLLPTCQRLSPELRRCFADNAAMSLSRRDSDSGVSSRSRAERRLA